MAEQVQTVRSLTIPLQGQRLVVPDNIILQVMTSAEMHEYDGAPNWLIGWVEWQKRRVPTMSFERASGQRDTDVNPSRILILKSLSNIERMPFYAMMLEGIPHPVQVTDDNVKAVENANISSPLILSQVLLDGEPAVIPNLDALEEMLMSQYGFFQQSSAA